MVFWWHWVYLSHEIVDQNEILRAWNDNERKYCDYFHQPTKPLQWGDYCESSWHRFGLIITRLESNRKRTCIVPWDVRILKISLKNVIWKGSLCMNDPFLGVRHKYRIRVKRIWIELNTFLFEVVVLIMSHTCCQRIPGFYEDSGELFIVLNVGSRIKEILSNVWDQRYFFKKCLRHCIVLAAHRVIQQIFGLKVCASVNCKHKLRILVCSCFETKAGNICTQKVLRRNINLAVLGKLLLSMHGGTVRWF